MNKYSLYEYARCEAVIADRDRTTIYRCYLPRDHDGGHEARVDHLMGINGEGLYFDSRPTVCWSGPRKSKLDGFL